MRLVLRENADPQVPGVDEIGKHEVDQSIGAAEGNRGFGPVRGQRIQPLTLPPARTMPSTCGASLMKQTYRPPRTPARSFLWNTHGDGLSINLFGSTRRRCYPQATTTVPGMRVAMMTR